MFLDKNLLLSDGQSITADSESTYSVNLGDDVDYGAGRPMSLVVIVDTAANSADAAKTLTISLVTDTVEALSSPTTVLSTAAILGSALTAGRKPIVIPIPPGLTEQYLGAYYDVSDTFTAFTVTAFLALDVQSNT